MAQVGTTERYPTLEHLIPAEAAKEIRDLRTLVYGLQNTLVSLKSRIEALEAKAK